MATITSLGVGSGLDLNTIVTQLVALEKRPLQAMQTQAGTLNSQISLYGQVNSLFSSMQTAAQKLTGNTLWQASSVTSGDSGTVVVSGGDGAAVGSYAVTVEALAGNQTVAQNTPLAAATDLVGQGTLTLQLGSWDAGQANFTGKPSTSAVSISVSATDTLADLRDKINGVGAGVTASLVTDATGVRLALRSNDSGAANGFRLSVDDVDHSLIDGAGLSRFAFDPPATTSGLVLKSSGSNARATVNGIAVESATNDVTGAVDGVTLSLRKTTATPVNVAVSRDTSTISAGIKSFVDAYNALAGYLSTQTKYDAASKTGGPLQGDSTATSLQSQLRSVLNTPSGASSLYGHLSDLGLQSQRDGTLTMDATKLGSALNTHLDEVRKAFANSDTGTTSNNGFARRYDTLASQALGVDGTVTTRTAGLQKLVQLNSEAQDKLSARVDLFQQRLIAQYTALDANVAKLNALQSYVTQQIAQMNKSTA